MEGVLGIFQTVIGTDNNYMDVFLNELDEHQCFQSKGTSVVVQHISSALSKPLMYREGLVLLITYLKQASLDVLEQKASLWTTLTLKAFNSKEVDTLYDSMYAALSLLASNSLRLTEVSKSFANNHLPKIYESLSIVSSNGNLAALKCTEECLRLYPGPSGPFRGSVEKFLMKFIDTTNEDLNIWTGKCMHLLQQVRGGGIQGMSHKASWLSYQQRLIGSLHVALDIAFANCNELYEGTLKPNEDFGFPVLELDNEPTKRAAQLFIRVRNLLNYLIVALRAPYPVPKPLLPKKILNLITRGLSVTCPVLEKNPISDNLALGVLLPKLHCVLLELLKMLILTLKSNLKTHHLTVLGLAVETLNWTSSGKNTGLKRPLSNLRCKAYEILSLWCSIMQNGSRIEIFADTLIKEVLHDVVPFQNECTLQVLGGSKKHMSKKARRQLHKAQNELSNLTQAHANNNIAKRESFSDEGNQKVCVFALKSLQGLLTAAANFLKPTLMKMIQIRVMQICGIFYELPMQKQQLYYNWECRLEIFKVAQVRDKNQNVRNQCAKALKLIENIIHPHKESLLFPADIRDIRNTFIKLGQERLLTSETPFVGVRKNTDENTINSDSDEEMNDKKENDSSSLCNNLTDNNDGQKGIDTSLQIDLSTDPKKIVEASTFEKNNKDEYLDFALQSKFTLRVDEDDIELKELTTCNADFEKSNECSLSEPELKKQRLEVNYEEDAEESTANCNALNRNFDIEADRKLIDTKPIDSFKKTVHAETDEDMLAEIEATFVDELS